MRDLGDGQEPVEDDGERETLRAQARRVFLRSGLLAVLGTVAILLLPL